MSIRHCRSLLFTNRSEPEVVSNVQSCIIELYDALVVYDCNQNSVLLFHALAVAAKLTAFRSMRDEESGRAIMMMTFFDFFKFISITLSAVS